MASAPARQVLVPYEQYLHRSPDEVAADLDSFCDLLTKWNRAQNLVSRETLGADFWHRHVGDSLRVLPLLRQEDLQIVDIGSGGGFPALPLGIALKGTDVVLRLVEPIARKAAFLRAVSRELGLNATVATARIETMESSANVDVVTARAVTALPALLALAAPLFGPQTRGLFHKGREYGEEVREAAAKWSFEVVVHRSADDTGGVLLEVTNLKPFQ